MNDLLQGFLPVAAILMVIGFVAFVRHFVGKELRRQKASAGDVGAPEGDARNFRLRSVDDDHLWDDV